MTMRSALRTSSNRAVVQMLGSVGIPEGSELRREAERRQAARRPVARARRERRHAGGADAAYGAFADGGIVRTPILIRRVEDSDGAVLYQERTSRIAQSAKRRRS